EVGERLTLIEYGVNLWTWAEPPSSGGDPVCHAGELISWESAWALGLPGEPGEAWDGEASSGEASAGDSGPAGEASAGNSGSSADLLRTASGAADPALEQLNPAAHRGASEACRRGRGLS